MFEERVAIGAVGEGHVQHLGVVQGLLHAITDGVIVILGLNDSNGDVGFAVKDVVGSFGPAPADQLASDDHSPLGQADFFAYLCLHVPTGLLHDGWGDEFGANVLLAEGLFLAGFHDSAGPR